MILFLPLITKLSSRSPRLEYFAITVSRYVGWRLVETNLVETKYYGKRVRHGEWILCDEVEFPSVLRICMHPFVRIIEFALTIYCLDFWIL
jgi:hypothetical protein